MIDKNPQPGRILVRDSPMVDSYFSRGGAIESVRGSRIYYRDSQNKLTWTTKNRIGAVCDTGEELALLLKFDRDKRQERWDLVEKQKAEYKALFT